MFQNNHVSSIKENKIRQAWNFLIEAKTYPDEVQGKLWYSLPLKESTWNEEVLWEVYQVLGPLDDLLQEKHILQIKSSPSLHKKLLGYIQ